jgi:hypothetical protein
MIVRMDSLLFFDAALLEEKIAAHFQQHGESDDAAISLFNAASWPHDSCSTMQIIPHSIHPPSASSQSLLRSVKN